MAERSGGGIGDDRERLLRTETHVGHLVEVTERLVEGFEEIRDAVVRLGRYDDQVDRLAGTVESLRGEISHVGRFSWGQIGALFVGIVAFFAPLIAGLAAVGAIYVSGVTGPMHTRLEVLDREVSSLESAADHHGSLDNHPGVAGQISGLEARVSTVEDHMAFIFPDLMIAVGKLETLVGENSDEITELDGWLQKEIEAGDRTLTQAIEAVDRRSDKRQQEVFSRLEAEARFNSDRMDRLDRLLTARDAGLGAIRDRIRRNGGGQ